MHRLMLITCFILISKSAGFCQNNSENQPYFFAIIVKNLDESIKWYQTVLDLEISNTSESKLRGIKQANLKSSIVWIELIEIKEVINQSDILAEAGPQSKITGFFKIGFQVEDFDLFLKLVEENELKVNGKVVRDSQSDKRMIILHDPDGNRVQFFEK